MADQKESIHVLDKDISTDEFIRRIAAYKTSRYDEDPFCVQNLSELLRRIERWNRDFGFIRPYFAIKCQNNTVTRRIFHRLGYGYDCATKVELENVLDTGCEPRQIVYANPYKQISHLPIAFKNDILTVVDTVEEVDKLKACYELWSKEQSYLGGRHDELVNGVDSMKINGTNGHSNGHSKGHSNGTNGVENNGHSTESDFEYVLGPQRKYSLGNIKPLSVLLRIENDTNLEDHQIKWSLSGKFGCSWDKFEDLVKHCKKQGTIVKGISFHVGQRATDADPWTLTVKGARECWDILIKYGYEPNILNIGGGFAGRAEEGMKPLHEIGGKVQASIKLHFGDMLDSMKVMAEPGTNMCAETQHIAASVITTKVEGLDIPRYHLSCGTYGGLMMYLIDLSNLPLIKLVDDGSRTKEELANTSTVQLYGNTLDSADSLGTAQLPALKVFDWIQFDELGDYYMELTTNFNGFPSPRLIYVCEEQDLATIEKVFGEDKAFKLVHVR